MYNTENPKQLLERCRKGDSAAMLAMAGLGGQKYADMWLVRAVLYGNEEARAILRQNPRRAQHTFLPILYFIPGREQESYGDFPAAVLEEGGFDNLPDQNGKYRIFALDKERVFILGEQTAYYEPDEYGFGEETDYYYYLYDEFFHRLPEYLGEASIDTAVVKSQEYYANIQDKLPKLRIDWLIEDGIINP